MEGKSYAPSQAPVAQNNMKPNISRLKVKFNAIKICQNRLHIHTGLT